MLFYGGSAVSYAVAFELEGVRPMRPMRPIRPIRLGGTAAPIAAHHGRLVDCAAHSSRAGSRNGRFEAGERRIFSSGLLSPSSWLAARLRHGRSPTLPLD